MTGSSLVTFVLSDKDIDDLRKVINEVENNKGILVRLADLMGGALGQAGRLGIQSIGISPILRKKIEGLTEVALKRAFDTAIFGLPLGHRVSVSSLRLSSLHRRTVQTIVTLSGVIGGFSGLAGLVPDISFTTLMLMREIAHIAREEGEDLSKEESRVACLEVFRLHSIAHVLESGNSEISFFSSRFVLRGRPLVLLIAEIASQYGLRLSQKIALQLIPVAGSLCGVALNLAFLEHYRSLARAHFTVRRLVRTYGPKVFAEIAHLQFDNKKTENST